MLKTNKRLWDIGRIAWDRLILTGAPPTPENYALWYHATGGTVAGLPEAMAELAEAGLLAQPAALESVKARFFPEGIKPVTPPADPIAEAVPETKPGEPRPSDVSLVYRVSGDAGDIMDAAAKVLSQADRAHSDYAETLAGLQPTHIDTPSSLKTAIRLLTEETDKVIGENTTLRAQLEGLSDRMRALREELATTQSELGRTQANLSEARIAADTDALTHLPNRRRFEQDLSALIRSADGKFCLVLADIDFFKNFNDQHGHVMGDQVLRLVAQGLARRVEKLGRAYRFGGEEFALLVRDMTLPKVFDLCEAIRRDVATREVVNRSTSQPLGRITLSAGVTAAQSGETSDSIINRADRALYAAKNQGRNRVIADPALAS